MQNTMQCKLLNWPRVPVIDIYYGTCFKAQPHITDD